MDWLILLEKGVFEFVAGTGKNFDAYSKLKVVNSGFPWTQPPQSPRTRSINHGRGEANTVL